MTVSTVWPVILEEAIITEHQKLCHRALKIGLPFAAAILPQGIHSDKLTHESKDGFMRMSTTALIITMKKWT